MAYYKVEPFGEDWSRTARQTLMILKGLGCNVDDGFIERFLPSYNPNREMTADEIERELTKFSGVAQVHKWQQSEKSPPSSLPQPLG